MRKKLSIVISLVFSAFLLIFMVGCGGGDKKTNQVSTKTAATQEVKKEEPKTEKTGFIIGTDVNAREKASTESAIVGTFVLGEKVTIVSDEPEWAKVKRSDGKECYVFKKFLGDQAALDKRQARYNKKRGPYPVYLNGDPNYILVDGHMGSAWYIVKSSVKREEISPNQWHIYCDIVSATETGNVSSDKPGGYTFFFDERNRGAGIAQKGLRLFNYNGPRSETMVINGAGAMAYYIAMGKKWPEFGFSDDVYSPADL